MFWKTSELKGKIVLKYQDSLGLKDQKTQIRRELRRCRTGHLFHQEIGDGMEYMELLKIVIHLYVKFYIIQ